MFQLPELDIGDWLYYEDIGDYAAAVASSTSLMLLQTTVILLV